MHDSYSIRAKLILGISVLLACPLMATTPEVPSSPETEESKGDPQQLLIDGDQLADDTKYGEALLRYKLAYQQIVPRLRGLEFKEAVNPALMSRSELLQHLSGILEEEISDEQMRLMDRGFKAFGFIPTSLEVKSTLLDLYTEEVAGFYHPATKKIFLITDVDQPKSRGLFGAIFGSRDPFNKSEQKVALAHEMAHALADQHYDLDALQRAAKDNDDRSIALSSLIEGEATLVMMAETMRESGNAQQVLQISPEYMKLSFSVTKGLMPLATGKTFRTAPLIFRESLMFPYLQGTIFVLHLTNRGKWIAVNEAFQKPPSSTEQILHPEKYYHPLHRDLPTRLVLPDLVSVVGSSWKELGRNVLGEFQIKTLLVKQHGDESAAGWDGDRYVVYENTDGQLGLIWMTTWDSVKDAKEFTVAYREFLHEKISLGSSSETSLDVPALSAKDQIAADSHWIVEQRAFHVAHRKQDVAIIEGFSEAETQAIAERIFHSKKIVAP